MWLDLDCCVICLPLRLFVCGCIIKVSLLSNGEVGFGKLHGASRGWSIIYRTSMIPELLSNDFKAPTLPVE